MCGIIQHFVLRIINTSTSTPEYEYSSTAAVAE